VFSPSPYGLPGNDDAGTMSAAYVLSAIGLYQAQPGFDAWELSAPLFRSVVIAHRLTITAAGARAGGGYIRSAQLNGRPLQRVWLRDRELRGHLGYAMAMRPSTWGTAASAAPPSLSGGS
jgi:putative alpha-1,2-mannosidase